MVTRPVIKKEDFHGFSQSLRANESTVLKIGPGPLPSTRLPIHYSLIA